MKFCYEVREYCCCINVRGLVSIGFCHYLIYGLFTVIFVFTNECYPPLYYVDYMFGISGATLIGLTIFGAIFAYQRNCQGMRCILAFLFLLNVLLIVTSTFYYTIERWNDVMVTVITSSIRSPLTKDFPDKLWFVLVVFACINGPILIFYMIFILSFMCNSWKSHLFLQPYQHNLGPIAFTQTVQLPTTPPIAPSANRNTA